MPTFCSNEAFSPAVFDILALGENSYNRATAKVGQICITVVVTSLWFPSHSVTVTAENAATRSSVVTPSSDLECQRFCSVVQFGYTVELQISEVSLVCR